MNRVSLDELIEALKSIPERYFTFGTVCDCLATHPVEELSMESYKFFDARQPTTTVIFKNDFFELVGICWEVAQRSAIQAYAGSSVWGVTVSGRLQLKTFRMKDEKALQMEEADVFEVKRAVAVISPDEPIHEWTNCMAYGQLAMSLHVFSPPVTTVTIYSMNRRRVQRVNYESMEGGRIVWRLS